MRHIPGTLQQADAMQRAEQVLGRVEAAEAEQAIVRAGQTAILNDIIDNLTRRVDAYVARREAQARQDAEREEREEQQRIQQQLDALPDPDNPTEFAPGGLTPTGPTTPEHERRLAAIKEREGQSDDVIEDNRVVATEGDRITEPDEIKAIAVPPELARSSPPEQGNRAVTGMKLKDPARHGYPKDPPQVASPVSVSLNEED